MYDWGGYVFVALRGDTFDGHDFINTAIGKGQQRQSPVPDGDGIICVEYAKAYQDLANFHRWRHSCSKSLLFIR